MIFIVCMNPLVYSLYKVENIQNNPGSSEDTVEQQQTYTVQSSQPDHSLDL